MTRIYADKNKRKIREDQCNPRHPRSILTLKDKQYERRDANC